MSKRDRIRRLLGQGLSSTEVAGKVGVTTQYVCQVRWALERPGYHAKWMRQKRAADPDYVARERKQQRDRYAGVTVPSERQSDRIP